MRSRAALRPLAVNKFEHGSQKMGPAVSCKPVATPGAPPDARTEHDGRLDGLQPESPVTPTDLGGLLRDLSPFVRFGLQHPTADLEAASKHALNMYKHQKIMLTPTLVSAASTAPDAWAAQMRELATAVVERDAAIQRAEAAEAENVHLRDKLERAATSYRLAQSRLVAAGAGWQRLGAAVSECRQRNAELEVELADARQALARQKKAYFLERGARLRQIQSCAGPCMSLTLADTPCTDTQPSRSAIFQDVEARGVCDEAAEKLTTNDFDVKCCHECCSALLMQIVCAQTVARSQKKALRSLRPTIQQAMLCVADSNQSNHRRQNKWPSNKQLYSTRKTARLRYLAVGCNTETWVGGGGGRWTG